MSMPFFNKLFTFHQPDGKTLQVRGTGDQYHAIFETLDGYTVVQDPVSGFYHYAHTNFVGELAASGIRAGAVNPALVGLDTGLRSLGSKSFGSQLLTSSLPRTLSRWEVRRNERRRELLSDASNRGIAPAAPQRKTVGNYVGLCLLVQFPDVTGAISQAQVDAFCNGNGYTEFSNNGSVHEYYSDVSGGKLNYTIIVAPFHTARNPRAYYTNRAVTYPTRAIELVMEALGFLKASGFDFSRLTVDGQNYVYAINTFYAGTGENNWSEGLWPHSYHLNSPLDLGSNRFAYDYQITDLTDELSLGTFCHENGHMICNFPDLYDYNNQSAGVGNYCLMCGGENVDIKNPVQICGYLKNAAGWAETTVALTPGAQVSLSSSENTFGMFRKTATEYYLVENRQKNGRDAALPDSGLAVWHVDEVESNNDDKMTPASHFECALVQADGRKDLDTGANSGDSTDLFKAGLNSELSDTTNPNANWWDGSASGLKITQISAVGPVMTFDVGSAPEVG